MFDSLFHASFWHRFADAGTQPRTERDAGAQRRCQDSVTRTPHTHTHTRTEQGTQGDPWTREIVPAWHRQTLTACNHQHHPPPGMAVTAPRGSVDHEGRTFGSPSAAPDSPTQGHRQGQSTTAAQKDDTNIESQLQHRHRAMHAR